jgi:Zn-dependent peptidase ImmA (M78 family)/DNA-binding XRE family transcriptional regulator
MIDGQRLKQAREIKPLTQEELASRVGLPQSVISRVEMGNYPTSHAEVIRLANALDVPVNFLFRSPIVLPEGSLGLFRSLASKVKTAEFRSARRLAEVGVEAILRLAETIELPPCRLQAVQGADPDSAAQHARSMLRLPSEEPISNLTIAMERAGTIMLRLSGISEHITGFGSWLDPVPGLMRTERALVVTRRPTSAFRLRFTIAHELGHLIMRHQVFAGPQQPVEREANLFAQALLMPREAALEDLHAAVLNTERLAELKGKWGMSMHAIAMRAKYLEVISESGYRSIYETLRAKGWLKQEPGDVKTVSEQPRLLAELIQRSGMTDSVYDLAERLDLGLPHVRALVPDEPDNKPLTFA